jgi:hypothetical protein
MVSVCLLSIFAFRLIMSNFIASKSSFLSSRSRNKGCYLRIVFLLMGYLSYFAKVPLKMTISPKSVSGFSFEYGNRSRLSGLLDTPIAVNFRC